MMIKPAKRSSSRISLKGEIPISPFPTLNGQGRESLERYKEDLWLIVHADPLEMFWEDEVTHLWRLRKPDNLPYRIRVAIKSLHRNKEGGLYYEMHNKDRATRLLWELLKEEAQEQTKER